MTPTQIKRKSMIKRISETRAASHSGVIFRGRDTKNQGALEALATRCGWQYATVPNYDLILCDEEPLKLLDEPPHPVKNPKESALDYIASLKYQRAAQRNGPLRLSIARLNNRRILRALWDLAIQEDWTLYDRGTYILVICGEKPIFIVPPEAKKDAPGAVVRVREENQQ